MAMIETDCAPRTEPADSDMANTSAPATMAALLIFQEPRNAPKRKASGWPRESITTFENPTGIASRDCCHARLFFFPCASAPSASCSAKNGGTRMLLEHTGPRKSRQHE